MYKEYGPMKKMMIWSSTLGVAVRDRGGLESLVENRTLIPTHRMVLRFKGLGLRSLGTKPLTTYRKPIYKPTIIRGPTDLPFCRHLQAGSLKESQDP